MRAMFAQTTDGMQTTGAPRAREREPLSPTIARSTCVGERDVQSRVGVVQHLVEPHRHGVERWALEDPVVQAGE